MRIANSISALAMGAVGILAILGSASAPEPSHTDTQIATAPKPSLTHTAPPLEKLKTSDLLDPIQYSGTYFNLWEVKSRKDNVTSFIAMLRESKVQELMNKGVTFNDSVIQILAALILGRGGESFCIEDIEAIGKQIHTQDARRFSSIAEYNQSIAAPPSWRNVPIVMFLWRMPTDLVAPRPSIRSKGITKTRKECQIVRLEGLDKSN